MSKKFEHLKTTFYAPLKALKNLYPLSQYNYLGVQP